MRTQIFISYRRGGGAEAARTLYDLLSPRYDVFYDMSSLRSGRFDEDIEQAIDSSSDFLLVMSDGIFDRFDEDGDWIRRETERAVRQKKNIIPILLDGFVPPRSADPLIDALVHYNGVHLCDAEKRLPDFLRSNERCVLKIEVAEGGEYRLSDGAIEALKSFYRGSLISGERGVHVVLSLPEPMTVAERLVSSELAGDKRKYALINASQLPIRRHRSRADHVALAIELMLADTVNIESAGLWSYLSGDPLATEHFLDGRGEIRSYYTVCLWVRVIEELLREFTVSELNRLTHYRARKNEYTPIGCALYLVGRDYDGEWGFTSMATKDEAAPLVTPTGYRTLRNPLSLSPKTVLHSILPDFYYKAAEELLIGRNMLFLREFRNGESAIHNLLCYFYGLD